MSLLIEKIPCFPEMDIQPWLLFGHYMDCKMYAVI